LVKGSTTIDRRGEARGCGIDVAVAAPATVALGENLVTGHSHHAPAAMTSTAAAAAAIPTRVVSLRRDAWIGTFRVGKSPIAGACNA